MGGRGDDRMTKRGRGTGLYGPLGGNILKVGVTSVVNQKLHKVAFNVEGDQKSRRERERGSRSLLMSAS